MDEKVTVQDQLDELLESKLNMKTAINNNGGEVTDETTFREYPEQIQEVIDKNIVPYSDLADTVELAININGLTFLDNLTLVNRNNLLYFHFPGKLDIGKLLYSDNEGFKIIFNGFYFSYDFEDSYSYQPNKIPYNINFPIRLLNIIGGRKYNLYIGLELYIVCPRQTALVAHSRRGLAEPLPNKDSYGTNIQQAYTGVLYHNYLLTPDQSVKLFNNVIPEIEYIDNKYYLTQNNINKIKEQFSIYSSEIEYSHS